LGCSCETLDQIGLTFAIADDFMGAEGEKKRADKGDCDHGILVFVVKWIVWSGWFQPVQSMKDSFSSMRP
jgi:hypothetical protein